MKPTLAPDHLRILLINTRVSRDTKAMVERVRRKFNKFPQITAKILDSMDLISESCLETLDKLRMTSDESLFANLQGLVETNQGLLASLGVSHRSLDRAIAIAAQNGLSAKLTGAGGGGFAFALLPPGFEAVETVTAQMEAEGFLCWETAIGGKGVIIN